MLVVCTDFSTFTLLCSLRTSTTAGGASLTVHCAYSGSVQEAYLNQAGAGSTGGSNSSRTRALCIWPITLCGLSCRRNFYVNAKQLLYSL